MYDVNIVGSIQVNDIKKNNDYVMWLKVARKVDYYLLDELLARYRKRSGSNSNKLIKWHYKLFREVDKRAPLAVVALTAGNQFFGVIKNCVM